jgi:hypothetical protein
VRLAPSHQPAHRTAPARLLPSCGWPSTIAATIARRLDAWLDDLDHLLAELDTYKRQAPNE